MPVRVRRWVEGSVQSKAQLMVARAWGVVQQAAEAGVHVHGAAGAGQGEALGGGFGPVEGAADGGEGLG
ncbi:hypothetical protein CTI14_69945, partial [Methylobacterium radiotolerans]